MSKDKTAGRRNAGAPVGRRPKAGPRLPEPQSECSTTGLITELSREVKAALRGRRRRREGPADGDPPKAA